MGIHVRIGTMVMAAVLLLAGLAEAGDKPWFDMQNCALCKPFMEDPELMKNTEMEQHEISNGIVMITTVKKELLPSYRAAHAKMMEAIGRIEKGDTLYLCGLCTAFGMLIERGAKFEYVETKHGDVSFMSSDDPEIVTAIKAMAAKSEEEMKKMEEMKKEHKHK
jgi:hypothetical protein